MWCAIVHALWAWTGFPIGWTVGWLIRQCLPEKPVSPEEMNRRVQDDLRRTWRGFYDERYRK